MIRQSPLQLDFTFFPVIRVEAVPGFQELGLQPPYGIREMLLNLTMRGPYPRIQLPPLQFVPDKPSEGSDGK